MRRRLALVVAFLFAGSLAAAPTAAAAASDAEPSPHCQEGGHCLFSGVGFTGAKVVLPVDFRCHPVSDLGFTRARSAARGHYDGTALELFAGTTCTTRLTFVHHEVPDTSARSYRLTPIPG